MEVLLHPQELRDLALEELRDRDASPLRYDVGDVLGSDLLGQHLLALLDLGELLLPARDLLFEVRED